MDAAEHKPFATLEDLRCVCSAYDDTSAKRAEMLLALVSSIVRQKADWEHIDADVLKLVVCQVVSRVLQAGTEAPIGATSETWQAAPFMGTVSYSNPMGDIYFTNFEKDLLGLNGCSVTVVNQRLSK